jgi:hypothetical protein
MTSGMVSGAERAEKCIGTGTLSGEGREFESVPYEITRWQGLAASGLPVPGLHRIEGTVDLTGSPEAAALVGRDLTLGLEDGRAVRIRLVDASGRVLAVGHGPSRCGCC